MGPAIYDIRVGTQSRTNVARSKSSSRWLSEHVNDPFVKRARAEGWRSRAVFKLGEIIDRDVPLRPGMLVIDLGATPGGWSQLLRERLGENGRLIALDILPMQGIAGVEFIQGDFREDEVLKQLEAALAGAQADLVVSDMAPNMSGVNVVDQARAMYLAELADDFAQAHLRKGGTFLTKLFQGEGFDEYVRRLRKSYARVSIRKPKASRARSNEVFALAAGKLNQVPGVERDE